MKSFALHLTSFVVLLTAAVMAVAVAGTIGGTILTKCELAQLSHGELDPTDGEITPGAIWVREHPPRD